jgi:glycogen debranching enzyme
MPYKKIIDKCLERAKEVIRICSTRNGLFASGGNGGYDAIWSRDSMISFLGASLVKDAGFKKTFRNSLMTLSRYQSKNGQIPNAVDRYSKRKPHVDFASIDSTLWYLIGQNLYSIRYQDRSFSHKLGKNIIQANKWLACQDTGERGMLTQLPTTDWQDAFPHKYGYVISTQALYYKILKIGKFQNEAARLKKAVNSDPESKLWNGTFYSAYRWKNHNNFKEIGNWFDSLGNLLSIIFGLADKGMGYKIISYIIKNKINKPFPVKAIFPSLKKGGKYWHEYFEDSDARNPDSYLNGGIWPYLGAFYILSLIKLNKMALAEKELADLAKANLEGNFPEWIHPKSKENFGRLQAWDAGMYILAHECVVRKKVLI